MNPKQFTEERKGQRSRDRRKPDIIIASLDAARNAFRASEGDDLVSWADFSPKTVTTASLPKKSFEWKDIFSAVELKQIKPKLPPPPEKYFVKPAKMIPPQPLPFSLHETLYDGIPTQHGPPPKPMVQSARYAAERLSHGIWISHAINLVIVGESSRNV